MVKIMKDIQPQKIKIYIKDIYKAKDRNIELIINNKYNAYFKRNNTLNKISFYARINSDFCVIIFIARLCGAKMMN